MTRFGVAAVDGTAAMLGLAFATGRKEVRAAALCGSSVEGVPRAEARVLEMPLAGAGRTVRAPGLMGLVVLDKAAAELGGRVEAADALPEVLALVVVRDIVGRAGVAPGDTAERRPLVDGTAESLREEAKELVDAPDVRETRPGREAGREVVAAGFSGLEERLDGALSPGLATAGVAIDVGLFVAVRGVCIDSS